LFVLLRTTTIAIAILTLDLHLYIDLHDAFDTAAELHDKKHQPDIENGRQMGMPLDEFTDELWAGLSAGKEDIPVGMGKAIWERIEPGRREEAAKFP
jgi:hypothetical protein